MRLISTPPNFILGTWICEAGVSGPDGRAAACGAPGGMVACGAACARAIPAANAAPDCRKVLREFDMGATSVLYSKWLQHIGSHGPVQGGGVPGYRSTTGL